MTDAMCGSEEAAVEIKTARQGRDFTGTDVGPQVWDGDVCLRGQRLRTAG